MRIDKIIIKKIKKKMLESSLNTKAYGFTMLPVWGSEEVNYQEANIIRVIKAWCTVAWTLDNEQTQQFCNNNLLFAALPLK